MAKNRRVRLTNYRRLYAESPDPVSINNLLLDNPDKDGIDLIFQKSDGSLDFVPSCECGNFKGPQFEGMFCSACSSVVKSNFARGYKPVNWMDIPPEMPSILHPRLYILLQSLGGRIRFSKGNGKYGGKRQKVFIIDFILDPTEELPEDIAEGVKGQGFTYFAEHTDEIMDFLCNKHPKLSKKDVAPELWKLYQREKEQDNVLIRQIPLLHPVFHPLHTKGQVKQLDRTADLVIPAIVDIITTSFANRNLVVSPKYADRELWKIYQKYIKYIQTIMQHKIGDKQALIRRHCVGSRMHFSGRGVISPILGKHSGDELHLPWNIAMVCFQLELHNLLVNREGMSSSEAIIYFYKHVNQYSEVLDRCFKTLIAECPSKGIPVFLNRNPTLIRESIRTLFVTKIKTNVHDKTINPSARICKGFNAEYSAVQSVMAA